MGKRLAFGLGIAALLWKVLSSYGDVDGKSVHHTGNNPHNLGDTALTNMVHNTSSAPQKMAIGKTNEGFRIAYDFRGAGVSFANTNRYRINFFDNNGDLYGVAPFSMNGTGFIDFYVNGKSLNNPDKTLAEGSAMHASVADRTNGWVCALQKDLGYNAHSNVNYSFVYNSNDLGKVVGSVEPLTVGITKSGNGSVKISWYGFDGLTYNVVASTNLCSNDWSNETSVVSTNNGVKSHDTNPGENKFYRLKAGVTPESKVLSTYKASLPKSTALMNYKRRKL
jgi:hypothetical protein